MQILRILVRPSDGTNAANLVRAFRDPRCCTDGTSIQHFYKVLGTKDAKSDQLKVQTLRVARKYVGADLI